MKTKFLKILAVVCAALFGIIFIVGVMFYILKRDEPVSTAYASDHTDFVPSLGDYSPMLDYHNHSYGTGWNKSNTNSFRGFYTFDNPMNIDNSAWFCYLDYMSCYCTVGTVFRSAPIVGITFDIAETDVGGAIRIYYWFAKIYDSGDGNFYFSYAMTKVYDSQPDDGSTPGWVNSEYSVIGFNGEYNASFIDFVNEYATPTLTPDMVGTGSGDYDKGYADGYEQGELDGYDDGVSTGYDTGYNDGYADGEEFGYSNGLNKGHSDNLTNPLVAVIEPVHVFMNTQFFGTLTYASLFNVVLFVAIALIFIKMFSGG